MITYSKAGNHTAKKKYKTLYFCCKQFFTTTLSTRLSSTDTFVNFVPTSTSVTASVTRIACISVPFPTAIRSRLTV